MNQDQLQGIFKQFSGGATACWGTITRDPAAVAAGSRIRLAGLVQEQRAISKQLADRQLAEFLHRHRKWSDLSSD